MKLFTAAFFASALTLITAVALPSAPVEAPATIPAIAARTPQFFSVTRCKHENGQGCEADNFTAEPGHCFNLSTDWNDVITGFDPKDGNFCILYHYFNCDTNGPSLGFSEARWNLMNFQEGYHNDVFSSFRCWRG